MASIATLAGYDGYNAILPEQVKLNGVRPPEWDDKAAASLVVQDYEQARSYLENQMWMAQWEENDILYQSPYLGGDEEGGDHARVSRFGVNNATNTMTDAVRAGLFSQKPPIFLRPRGKTTQNEVDGWMALLDVLLDRMKFRYWTGLGIDSQGLHGTGIMKGGWSVRKRTVKRRKRKVARPVQDLPVGGAQPIDTKESNEMVLTPKTITESYPWIENRMLGTTLFDSGWRTPNAPELSSKFAIDVDYPTWTDLEALRELPCYKIPDSEALKNFFFQMNGATPPTGTQVEQVLSDEGSAVMHAEARSRMTSADVLLQPILMLERTTETSVMAVLLLNGRYICIRNEKENDLGRLPHFTFNWRNIINSGYGMGIGKLAGGDQRLEQGVLNHAINLLAYQLSPAILTALGMNAPTQNREVRAGGFFPVQPIGNDVRNAMAVMEMPKVPPEVWTTIKYSQDSSEKTVGDDATFMQGQLGGKGSSAARTATGAGAISAKANGRIQTPVENVEQGLIVPWVNMVIDMVKMYMPLEEIQQLLTKKLSAAIMAAIDMESFLDAEMDVEALAGAKLAAKAAMSAQLPYLMQIFQQPQLLEQLHAVGKTIDLQVILDVLFQVSEFRNEKDIIRDMTDQEKQAAQASNPAQIKVQGDLAIEQAKGQNALALEDKKAENQLGVTLAEKGVDSHMQQQGQGPSGGKDGRMSPLDRATGLVQRGGDEKVLQGQNEPVLAGV